MKTARRLLALLFVFALIAAACGGDDDTTADAPDDQPAAEQPAEEPADEPDAGDGDAEEGDDTAMDEVSGDPIVLGSVLGSAGEETYISSRDGLLAGVEYVNANGGINGQPVEVEFCRDEQDPNIAIQCMQDVIDAGAVTFVANFNCCGAQLNPEILAAGYVTIGGFMLTGGDLSTPAADGFYSHNGGVFVAGAGQAPACAALGAERIAAAFVDVESGQQLPGVIEGVLGIELVASEPMPVGTADFAPIAAKIIAAEPDCVLGLSGKEQVVGILQALRQQGYTGLFTGSGSTVTAASMVADVGEAADNMVIPHIYDHSSPIWDDYVAALAVAAPDTIPDDIGVGAFLSVVMAAELIGEVGADPAAVTAAVESYFVDYDTQGLTQTPIDWSAPGENPLGLTTIRDTGAIPTTIIDGEEVISDVGWVGLFG